MGRVQQRGVLRIGIPDDPRPPFSFTPPGRGPQGFVIDLAAEVAAALDVETEFLPLAPDQLLAVRTLEGQALDLSFPMVPTTEVYVTEKCERETDGTTVTDFCRHVSDPFYVGHQRLLVRRGSGIADLEFLSGREVCSASDPVTGVDISKLNREAQVIDAADPGECALLLENGRVDAVTALDVDLVQIWAGVTDCMQPCPPSTEFSLVGDDITTIGLGAAMPPDGSWAAFVNDTWQETDAEGRWLEFHKEWIGPYGIELEEAPSMTVEEAAGLFPCDPRVPQLACKKKL